MLCWMTGVASVGKTASMTIPSGPAAAAASMTWFCWTASNCAGAWRSIVAPVSAAAVFAPHSCAA